MINPYEYVALQPHYDFTYEIYNYRQRRNQAPRKILITGEEIVKKRLRLGLSQKQLAEALSVKHRIIKDAESGDRRPSFDLAKKLEKFFEQDKNPQ